MVYRIIIQEVNGKKYKNIKQFRLDTLEGVEEIENIVGYLKYCQRKAEEYEEKRLKKLEKEFFESDLFDKKSVGYDISYREFLDNEIFFDTR